VTAYAEFDNACADKLYRYLRLAAIATQRCLHILNDLGRYKAENDKQANGLSDLSIPGEDTIDPYSGDRLVVKLTEEGWMVYTVFNNGQDDGGSYEDLRDWGLSP
jgi:hypothetical protein